MGRLISHQQGKLLVYCIRSIIVGVLCDSSFVPNRKRVLQLAFTLSCTANLRYSNINEILVYKIH